MAYTAGAVAAGAAATSADAAVVYSPGFSFAVADTKAIDFDHNGLEEFNLGHERTGEGAAQEPNTDRLILKDKTEGGSEGYLIDPDNTFNIFPAPLAAGAVIGPDQLYGQLFNNNSGNRIVDEDSNNNNVVDDGVNDIPTQTNFAIDNIVGNPQYLGVRFKLNNEGDDRYGYIGIDITNAADLTGVVTSFAYEDTGAAIEAGAVPEPSSGLALLALGAAGVLRRKRA
jgi:hypothetical protein